MLGRKRKREDGFVHSRTGPQVEFSTLFAAVWDIHWRSRLDACESVAEWKSLQRAIIVEACEPLELPKHYWGYEKMIERPIKTRDVSSSVREFTSVMRLQRDDLWLKLSERQAAVGIHC